jgi:Bacterial Ig-like domain (group 2)
MSKRKVFIFCCGMLLAVSPATASRGDNRASVIFGRPVELPGLVGSMGTSALPCDEGVFIINPNPRGVSPAATLTSLRVSPAIAQIRGIGASQPFAAVGTYSDGSARCLTALVSWTSSDPSVATISDAFGTNGLATGNGLGLTMITAAFENLNSSALLTVSPIWCRWPMGITNDRRPVGQQVRRVDEILRSSEGPRVPPVSGHRFRRSKFTMNRPSALISMSVTNR